MATVQLEDGAALELLAGEEVIFSNPKVARMEGKIKETTFNFAITNKRIALVRYPKWDKEGKGTDTINYTDIFTAEPVKDQNASDSEFNILLNEKKKIMGFTPVYKKVAFRILTGFKEEDDTRPTPDNKRNFIVQILKDALKLAA